MGYALDSPSRGLLKHAAGCHRCSARLQEEQFLSRSFAEIAAHVGTLSPSLEIEPLVMKAFDRQRQFRSGQSGNWPRYVLGAIAAILLVVTTISLAWLHREPNAVSPGLNAAFDFSAAVATMETGEHSQALLPATERRESRARSTHTAISPSAITFEEPFEIATEFIRINEASTIESGGQIVRIQLPRSAMSQFGLPVNMNRADQPVKADVIMGIDGFAQAIRFVQ